MKKLFSFFFSLFILTTLGCEQKTSTFLESLMKKKESKKSTQGKRPLLIKGAKIYTVAGKTYEKANLLVENGLIKKISESDIKINEQTLVIDGAGKQVTPGIIDVHSHMGVYPNPSLQAHRDGNEAVKKSTAEVSAQDSFWPQDPSIWRAIAGGITTIQVLPGSANLVGGTSFTARMLPDKTDPKDMRFPGAPVGMKMACGENPKRVYGKKGGPSTRMGNAAEFRRIFQEAKEYAAKLKSSKEGEGKGPSKKKFAQENLSKVLSGDILLHIHCYRADDINVMINIAKEYGIQIKTFQHALEAYKLKDRLREENIGSATWADWWGFKAEAYDGIPYNVALLEEAGAKVIVHSDSERDIRFLNIEAAKAWRSGLELGLKITEEQVLSWITKNAAWSLGIDDKVGTLEEGKFADIAIWDGHPFSSYTKTTHVIVDGEVIFDREKSLRPQSDFEVGYQEKLFMDGRNFSKVSPPQKVEMPSFQQEWFAPSFAKSPRSFVLTNVKLSLEDEGLKHIHVVNGVIANIYTKKQDQFGLEDEVIDGKGRLLTAGLVESFAELGLVDISAEGGAQDHYDSSGKMSPALRSSDALNLDGPRIRIERKEGVTTAISSVITSRIFGEAVAFDLVRDGSFHKEMPYLASNFSKQIWSSQRKSRAWVWKDLRRLAAETAKNKYEETFLLTKRDYPVLKKYFKGDKPWVVSLDRSGDIKRLIRFKDEVKKNHGFNPKFVILGGVEAWKVAPLLKENKIPVILGPTSQTPNSFEQLFARDDHAALLRSKGVDVMVTSAGSESGTARLRQEAAFAIKYGLKWSDALSSITKAPAKVFNLKGLGEIKVGSKANFVLWTGDLFEPFHTAQSIWIDGQRRTLSNRQRLLAEKYK